MKIKNVSRIRLSSRRSSEKQTERTIGHGVFGQIVVYYEHVLSFVHKIFSKGAAGVRSYIQNRGGVARRGVYDYSIVHCPLFSQRLFELSHGARFLSYRDVNADNVFPFLIYYCVDGDSRFPRLSVPYYQFSLASADREHRVYRQKTGFKRFADRLSVDYSGSRIFYRKICGRSYFTFPVYRVPERIHDSAQEFFPDGHSRGFSRSPDGTSLKDGGFVPEKNTTDFISIQIENHSFDSRGENYNFPVSDSFEPCYCRYPVSDALNRAELVWNRFWFPFFDSFGEKRYYVSRFSGKAF